MKVKKGDNVKITTGKDSGKTGKVLRVFPDKNRVLVEDMALQTRHRKPRRGGEKGQRVTIPGPISVSNVMVICGKCDKPTRVGSHVDKETKTKARGCKKCGANL